jgi:hypothetical protein
MLCSAAAVLFAAASASAQDPVLLSHYTVDPPRFFYDFALVDEKIYMAGFDVYHEVDVSDPAQPTGTVTTSPIAVSVEHANGCLFVAGYLSPTLRVTSPDPFNPACAGTWDLVTTGAGLRTRVEGGLAYLVTDPEGIRILDVSSLPTIAEVGSFDPPERVSDVAPFGNYAFVAAGPAGLFVLDVSDPSLPVLINTITGVEVDSLRVGASLLYAGGDELRIYDLSFPASPALIGHLPVRFRVANVDEGDGLAYDTRRVVDISNPFQPVEIAQVAIDSPFGSLGADGEGDLYYVSDLVLGLYTYRIFRPDPRVVPLPMPHLLAVTMLIVGWRACSASAAARCCAPA